MKAELFIALCVIAAVMWGYLVWVLRELTKEDEPGEYYSDQDYWRCRR